MGKYIVTAALPYVNAVPHLGNLIGSHLPADVYARYLRLKGEDVVFVGGTDEHGTTTEMAAKKAGKTPSELCDHMYSVHKELYGRFGISYDNFSQTSRPVHHKLVQEIFSSIHKNGYISEKTVEQAYCSSCGMFLADRYVHGTCPSCSFEDARGDQCDNCGKLLDPHDLVNPACATCGTTPSMRETTHLFFDLEKLSPKLESWIEGNTHWKDNSRNFALSWIKSGLKSRAITRDLSWGVPVPMPGYEDKVFYVWFDAPIGYISSTIEWAEREGTDWESYWKDPDTKIIHFIGKDNIPFHAIFWPGEIFASDMGFTLPWQLGSFEYLNYDHRKFSKSRHVGVFCDKALSLYPADYWRYVLLSLAPEKCDTDFTWIEFQKRVNAEFADNIGNLFYRTLTFITNFFDSIVPEPMALSEKDLKLVSEMVGARDLVGTCIEEVRYKEALQGIQRLASLVNSYTNDQEPWSLMKLDVGRVATVIYVLANACKTIAVLLSPFTPTLSKKTLESFGVSEPISWENSSTLSVAPGTRVERGDPLVKKVSDKEVAMHHKKFSGKQENKPEDTPGEGLKKISYGDFSKLELCLGKVVSCIPMDGSRNLLECSVDVGEGDNRIILAGLKNYYEPEELVGKTVVVLSNLEKKKMMGKESDGMMLAAGEGDVVKLLTVEDPGEFKPGEKVC